MCDSIFRLSRSINIMCDSTIRLCSPFNIMCVSTFRLSDHLSLRDSLTRLLPDPLHLQLVVVCATKVFLSSIDINQHCLAFIGVSMISISGCAPFLVALFQALHDKATCALKTSGNTGARAFV